MIQIGLVLVMLMIFYVSSARSMPKQVDIAFDITMVTSFLASFVDIYSRWPPNTFEVLLIITALIITIAHFWWRYC